MALAIDANTLAALQAGRFVDRGMVLFDLASGFYGFWTGIGPFEYASVTYVGAGRVLAVEGLAQHLRGEAVPVTITMQAIPDSDLSPDVLATIEDETYHQRPVVISTAFFAPDTRALLSVEAPYRGYVDRIEHIERGGETSLVVRCESRARDHLKTNARIRSDADQRQLAPDDGSWRHAGEAGTRVIPWGREQDAAS